MGSTPSRRNQVRQFGVIMGSKFSKSVHVSRKHSGSCHCSDKSLARPGNERFDLVPGLLGPRVQVNLGYASYFVRQRLWVHANLHDLLDPRLLVSLLITPIVGGDDRFAAHLHPARLCGCLEKSHPRYSSS